MCGDFERASFLEDDPFGVDVCCRGQEAIVPVAVGDGSLPFLDFDLDGLVGELLEGVEYDTSTYGESPIFALVVDSDRASQTVTEVRGREGEDVPLELKEDVLEYGYSRHTLAGDDLRYSLQLLEKVVAGDSKFHSAMRFDRFIDLLSVQI